MSYSVALGSVPAAQDAGHSLNRIAGFAGLAFAIVVGFVNIFIGSLQPPAVTAAASDIVPFIQDNKAILTVAFASVPAGVFLLFAFVASAYQRLASGSREAAFWARFGLVGVVLVEAMFLVRTVPELVLVANIDRLAGEAALVETLWQMQGAAMTANGLALAVALTGLARSARLSDLIPTWQEWMAHAGAALFVIGAVTVIPSLQGSPVGIAGLIAFVTWIVWLAMTSVRLLRSNEQTG